MGHCTKHLWVLPGAVPVTVGHAHHHQQEHQEEEGAAGQAVDEGGGG